MTILEMPTKEPRLVVASQMPDREPDEVDLIQIWMEIIGRDTSGKITDHTIQETRSWVKQTPQLMRGMFTYASQSSIKDTGGTLRNTQTGVGNPRMAVRTGTSSVTRNIIAGTGTTAAAKDDNVIETLITDGAGAGQLEYGASLTFVVNTVTGGYRLTIDRTLTNDSSGNITVNEVAMYAGCNDAGGVERQFMIIRDIISGGKVITSGGSTQQFKYHLDFIN